MSAPQLLGLYRFTFSALIALASLQTLSAAREDPGVALLAAAEVAGALGLCWRRTQWLGAALLLGVFACAQVVSALHGEWPTRFLLYAASALLIVMLDGRLLRPD
jgi:hypothetical protein